MTLTFTECLPLGGRKAGASFVSLSSLFICSKQGDVRTAIPVLFFTRGNKVHSGFGSCLQVTESRRGMGFEPCWSMLCPGSPIPDKIGSVKYYKSHNLDSSAPFLLCQVESQALG